MFISRASEDDIYNIALQMRKRDYEEIVCMTWADGREDLAEFLVKHLAGHENVYCFGDERPVGIVSYVPVRPGVWSLGMYATTEFEKVGRFLTRVIIKDIIPALDRANAHRVEALSISGYDSVHRWLEFIGLKKENVVPGFGRDGEDFVTFAYVRKPNTNPGVRWRKPGEIS